MLQYVLAGLNDYQWRDPERSFYVITIEQAETDGDVTNHLAFAQVGKYMIDVASKGPTCPVPSTPRGFSFQEHGGLANATDAPDEVTIAGRSRSNTFEATDGDDLKQLQAALASQGVSVQWATAKAGQAGMTFVLAGYLEELPRSGLFIALSACQCRLPPPNLYDFEQPHPLILTLTLLKGRGSSQTEYVAYNHLRQWQSDKTLSGFLFDDPSAAKPAERPLRMFQFRLNPSGGVDATNFRIRAVKPESPSKHPA
jgi:hypothetical protein